MILLISTLFFAVSGILATPVVEEDFDEQFFTNDYIFKKSTDFDDNDYTPDEFELIQPIDFDFDKLISYDEGETHTIDMIRSAGYVGQTYQVTTEDNYILELHRISGSKKEAPKNVKKPVVLIMHGLFCSSACMILSGPGKSLAYILADKGYDVWLGNSRGSSFSRKHVNWNTMDKKYWEFSWHEMGIYDLPAMIDYILEETKQEKIFYVGHSQGTTSFFVMASERPEYQSKVEAMFAMAPVAYCSRMFSPVLRFLSLYANRIKMIMDLIGLYEFEPTSKGFNKFAKMVCANGAITQPLCSNIFFLITGFSVNQFNMTLLPTITEHVPAGSSTRQLVHYAQLIRSRKFRQYDHGLILNKKKYGHITPPEYNLESIKVPVYLHYSVHDWLASVRDVHQLHRELGNPVAKLRVPGDTFNHIDFMWGIDAPQVLYEKITALMLRHRKNDLDELEVE